MEQITSTSNPRIKDLLKLQEKSSERRAQGRIVVEGGREIGLAVQAGAEVLQLFVCRALLRGDIHPETLVGSGVPVTDIALNVFEKLAYRDGSDGLIAVARPPLYALEDIVLSSDPLVLVLEAVEKPGNLGAILRTADAAGVSAVLVCDPLTDLYNPNVIRSSIGCVFTVPVAACASAVAAPWLRKAGLRILAAALQDAEDFYNHDLRGPTAIVLGTEAHGLSSFWREEADAVVKIPMLGRIDSLNVAASTAAMVYEAVRQRQHH